MTQNNRHGFAASFSLPALPKRLSLSLLAALFGSIMLASPANSQQSTTSTPPTLTYQAVVNRSGPMKITARLYSDPSGIDLLWEETTAITAINGVLNLELGSAVALPLDQMGQAMFLGLSIDHSDELRPLTKLTASPMALSVPDGAITKAKIDANFIESITINGRKIEGHGATLKIATGNGITAGYDEGSNTVLLAASSARSKGSSGTLADETIDGNLTVNGNTNLGGNAVSPTITFTAKAASDLDMNSNDFLNVGTTSQSGNLALTGSSATISLAGEKGTAGQVLTSQGASSTPSWTTPANSWGVNGKAGTTAGTDYLGTSDDQPFEIHVHHDGSASEGRQRALRLEPNGTSPNVILGHNLNTVDAGYYGGTIGGGGDVDHPNYIIREFGTIGGGRSNMAGQHATIGGGEYNEATNAYATVGGGYSNRSTNTYSTTAGGYMNWARGNSSFIGAGEENEARGNLSVIGGGFNNNARSGASTIGGGEWNTTESAGATIAGGSYNYADGSASAISGGENNYASGFYSAIGGGEYNTSSGHYSSIAGGRYLALGGYSFGFNAETGSDQTNLTAMTGVTYFGNTDMLLGNVDDAARALRFYAPNTSFDYSAAYYTSFKAPSLSDNIEYTLPSAQGANTSVLSNDGSGELYWEVLTLNGDVTGPVGSNTVQLVGGQPAANVATATSAANAATSVNTANTIVRRNASGNFAAGVVTGSLVGDVTGNLVGQVTGTLIGQVTGNLTGQVTGNVTGNVTGDVTGNAGTVTNGVYTTGSYANPTWITSLAASKITGLPTADSVRASFYAVSSGSALTAASATNSTNATNAVNATNAQSSVNFTGPLSGDVTGTQSATVVSSVGALSATNVAAGATLANNATSSNTASTIARRDANGDISVGTLSASDGVTLSGGVLTLAGTTVASANAGISIPSGYSIVRITAGATANFNYTLPSGTEGQVLYIYNSNSTRRANNAVGNIDSGAVKQFLYLNSGWRIVG